MARMLRIFAIAGSIRTGSFNRMTLDAAKKLAPEHLSFDVYENLAEIPPYNEDVREKGYPPVVQNLRDRIRAADALLFVTPEYNFSVPGLLKNVIDWASRPPDQPFDRKPVGIMSASQSMIGGARAQYHLRQTLVFLNAFPINRPEVIIPFAQQKFDESGALTDEATRKFIAQHLENLGGWAECLLG